MDKFLPTDILCDKLTRNGEVEDLTRIEVYRLRHQALNLEQALVVAEIVRVAQIACHDRLNRIGSRVEASDHSEPDMVALLLKRIEGELLYEILVVEDLSAGFEQIYDAGLYRSLGQLSVH